MNEIGLVSNSISVIQRQFSVGEKPKEMKVKVLDVLQFREPTSINTMVINYASLSGSECWIRTHDRLILAQQVATLHSEQRFLRPFDHLCPKNMYKKVRTLFVFRTVFVSGQLLVYIWNNSSLQYTYHV